MKNTATKGTGMSLTPYSKMHASHRHVLRTALHLSHVASCDSANPHDWAWVESWGGVYGLVCVFRSDNGSEITVFTGRPDGYQIDYASAEDIAMAKAEGKVTQ